MIDTSAESPQVVSNVKIGNDDIMTSQCGVADGPITPINRFFNFLFGNSTKNFLSDFPLAMTNSGA